MHEAIWPQFAMQVLGCISAVNTPIWGK